MSTDSGHTLLIIDDSAVLRRQVLEFLKDVGIFAHYLEAENGLDGLKVLLNNKVDVILCDLEMPGIDGLKFLAMHNAREDLKDIPVIMLTGHEEQDKKVLVLEQGASDYITKPFDAGELIARVKVQLKIKILQDDLKEQNRRLEQLSKTDTLTGLANRRSLMEFLEKEYSRLQRNGIPLSLIMIDIDHFKKINDTYGHNEGDTVLKKLSELMQEQLRDYDLAARFGGEEFVLVLPETERQDAVKVASRLRQRVSSLKFDKNLLDLAVTISLGVASCPHSRILSVDDLIRFADDALYAAKREGRNRVVIADLD